LGHVLVRKKLAYCEIKNFKAQGICKRFTEKEAPVKVPLGKSTGFR